MVVDGISKTFGGVNALHDVSFVAPRGRITGIMGPNGAGKSTLLSCLSGWLRPDTGSVDYDGHELVGLRPLDVARLGVIRTFQNLQLFDELTVMENLLLGGYRLGRSGLFGGLLGTRRARIEEEQVTERAEQTAQRLGLLDVSHSTAGSLPYGTRKKLEFARALMARPQVLLLDEPAAGLDDHERAELSEVMVDLSSDAAVILVEHAVEMVLSLSSTVVVIDFGSVIAKGRPEEIREHPFVLEAYLGAQS